MFVFLDRHQFAGALLLLEQDLLFAGGVHLVVPAAGIGTRALVRVAPVEVAGEQAAARVGDAQRAVHEDFELDVRALLADFGDFVERQFARQDDAVDAHFLPETDRRPIDRVGLHRQVDHLFRPGFAHQVDQPGVGHDQRVGLERDDRRHVVDVSAHFRVVREDVADHVEALAAGAGLGHGLAEAGEVAELVVAHAQRVARLAGVDRVGAEGEGGAHHRERAGGCEEFGGGRHSRMRQDRAFYFPCPKRY